MKLTIKQIRDNIIADRVYHNICESLPEDYNDATEVSIAHILSNTSIMDTFSVIFYCIEGKLEQKLGMIKEIGESQLHLYEKRFPSDKSIRYSLRMCYKMNSTKEERDKCLNDLKTYFLKSHWDHIVVHYTVTSSLLETMSSFLAIWEAYRAAISAAESACNLINSFGEIPYNVIEYILNATNRSIAAAVWDATDVNPGITWDYAKKFAKDKNIEDSEDTSKTFDAVRNADWTARGAAWKDAKETELEKQKQIILKYFG